MFDQCSRQRNGDQQAFVLKRYTNYTSRQIFFCIVVFTLFVILCFYTRERTDNIFWRKLRKESAVSSHTILARVLYLFLCENQTEVDAYSRIFPSITADVVFYCWRQNCVSTNFRPSLDLFVTKWTGQERNRTLIRLDAPLLSDKATFYPIRSRAFIINEKQLNLTRKMTWTTSRNKLFELALAEEQKQGWRWAYFNFADGDIHMACPLAEQLLTNKSIVDYGGVDELVVATQFRSLVNLSILSSEAQCFVLFDAFLFSASPAIGITSGSYIPIILAGLLSQIVYHVDAMFNAIHRDAVPFLLPYCARYDERSWWTSQAIFIYRSLCLYGHVIQFDGVHIIRYNHRSYPRAGDPWAIDGDMNLVPRSLIPLQHYMKTGRVVSPLVLSHYPGWNSGLTSDQCRHNHTAMDLDTCLVHGRN